MYIIAVALLFVAAPANSSPLCERAVAMEYGNTSDSRPKWAVRECQSVEKAARVFGVREPLAVAVAAHESDFDPMSISSASEPAAGTMQIKPAYHCPVWFLGLKWCTNRGQWVRSGVRHLAELLDDYPERDALRCYNKGERGCRNPKAGRGYASVVRRIEGRL